MILNDGQDPNRFIVSRRKMKKIRPRHNNTEKNAIRKASPSSSAAHLGLDYDKNDDGSSSDFGSYASDDNNDFNQKRVPTPQADPTYFDFTGLRNDFQFQYGQSPFLKLNNLDICPSNGVVSTVTNKANDCRGSEGGNGGTHPFLLLLEAAVLMRKWEIQNQISTMRALEHGRVYGGGIYYGSGSDFPVPSSISPSTSTLLRRYHS